MEEVCRGREGDRDGWRDSEKEMERGRDGD